MSRPGPQDVKWRIFSLGIYHPDIYKSYRNINIEAPIEEQVAVFKRWLDDVHEVVYMRRCFNALKEYNDLYTKLAPYLIKEAEEIGYDLGLSDDVNRIVKVSLNTNHKL